MFDFLFGWCVSVFVGVFVFVLFVLWGLWFVIAGVFCVCFLGARVF